MRGEVGAADMIELKDVAFGMIELKDVVYDMRARDGTWCCLPYPGHGKGCPNFPK